MTENDQFILEIKNLSIGLPKTADRAFAVEDASLQVNKGEVLCIVGESGSGKSVMTSAILKDIRKVDRSICYTLQESEASSASMIRFIKGI